ncbi:DUF2304 domain-containing protein [Kutzneria buriramensis]|uniref:DUF2304 domain-containing protein n=1 Tax=Kutzneria buriramensis TaxID=1045776 RepID=A0A3E0HVN0_9PSEU|nr:DUF2304 domain-containing protein [Kutzneria buriramensis]REH50025.1 hypothetical protein BCF44_104292 [Kutzneria buriramensis]
MSVATQILGIVASLVLVAGIIEMLRRRQFTEKYAVMWLVVAVIVLVLAIWPHSLVDLANLIGIAIPTNLLFFVAIVFTVGVSVHQSWELSRLESETRKLAEDLAILRLEIEEKLKDKADN